MVIKQFISTPPVISHTQTEHTCCHAPPPALAALVGSAEPLMTGTETHFSSQTMKMEAVLLRSCTKWQKQTVLHSPVLNGAYIQKRWTNSTTKVYHNVVIRMGWPNRHLLKSALIRGLAPRVKHFQGKLEANYLHSISNAHLNKLPIEYEWWSHLDNDKHILGLIKGCAGRSEVLNVPHYRAKEHMYQSLLSAAGRCQVWGQPAVFWKSWLKFHKSKFFKGSFTQTQNNRDRLLYMFLSSTWIYLAW